jgi:cytochrome c
MWTRSAIVLWLAATVPLAAQSPTYGVGRPPTPDEIRALGSAIAPDGGGLPEGSGTVATGREVFAAQCSRCHGPNGEGNVGPVLAGGQGTLATARPLKTIGSYWPYATTLWDYINRAMPFDQPGLLKPPEVYAAVAYLLNLNGIIREDQVIDATSLAENRDAEPQRVHSGPSSQDPQQKEQLAGARAARSFHEHVPVIARVFHNRRHIFGEHVTFLHE